MMAKYDNQAVKYILAREETLYNEYSNYLPVWKAIRNVIAPKTARFINEMNLSNRGARGDSEIINSSAMLSARTLPSGMQSGITSPLRPWFKLSVQDPELSNFSPVKAWLTDVERQMRNIMSNSNIYDRFRGVYRSLGNYGTGVMFIDEDEEDIIRAHDLMFGSYYVASNHFGRNDTLFRIVYMTTIQLVKKFGLKALSQAQRNAYDRSNYYQTWETLHVTEPNSNYKPGSALPHQKKFISLWIDKTRSGTGSIIKISGYDDIPFMAPRWDVVADDPWGVGCGEVALGDVRQVQHMDKRKLQALDRKVMPTMVADASMRNTRTSVLPGDTVYVNGLIGGNAGYKPAYEIGNIQLGEITAEVQALIQRVDEAYYKNLFLMVANLEGQPSGVTATQINMMREEKLMMLGPVLERLNDEMFSLIIDRVFAIASRRGLFPDPPEEIQGQKLKVEYTSVLAQAQKAIGIGNIERFVGFTGNLSQFNPEVWDKIDMFEMIDEYADSVSLSPKMIRTNDEAMQIGNERKQQAQQQQAIEQGGIMAKTAHTLSQIPLDKETALTRAMEVVGGA